MVRVYPGGRIIGKTEGIHFEIDLTDLLAVEEFGIQAAEGIPRDVMIRWTVGIEAALSTSMEAIAMTVSDTGRMASSVETNIDIVGAQATRVTGNYNVPYEEFVDQGTGPSLGRFVRGLIPRDTTYWNMLGARISTKKGLTKGRVYGWHPGTPPQHIWDRVEELLDEKLAAIQKSIADEFRLHWESPTHYW